MKAFLRCVFNVIYFNKQFITVYNKLLEISVSYINFLAFLYMIKEHLIICCISNIGYTEKSVTEHERPAKIPAEGIEGNCSLTLIEY